MGYVESNLMQGEKLYAEARLHWVVFVKAMVFAVVALLLIFSSFFMAIHNVSVLPSVTWYAACTAFLVAIWYAADAFVRRQSTELAVTSKRVIAKFGLIRRKTIEFNHSKIEGFYVEQGLFGRLLGYGTLSIKGTGGGITPMAGIDDPLGFRRKAIEAIDAFQQRPV